MPEALTSVTPWRQELAQSLRDPDALWQYLQLPPEHLPAARALAKEFPLVAPMPFVRRITPQTMNDPLLMQLCPVAAEAQAVPGFSHDPVGERLAQVQPGMLRKYHGRALLITTSSCAIHCRYCFRRHFPYAQRARGPGWWRPAIAHIAADDSIDEVILSGGDPLMLSDEQLAQVVSEIAAIQHVQRLRIHSRLPIMIPQRLDLSCRQWLNQDSLQMVLVLHANHAQEIDEQVCQSLQPLRQEGVHLLNQAVLLRGINDSAQAQRLLGERLLSAGVLPYYLHALDPVAGAAHFHIGDQEAIAIMDELHRLTAGYLVPRLVREVPGEAGKRWIWPSGNDHGDCT
ncbi:MAG: EF-P beta-lysylation protein EpmB [Planctomycetota bacterium]|nr:MAG: EF-P beta-lysylation protein EpmB [Planctomycetota bacterium]